MNPFYFVNGALEMMGNELLVVIWLIKCCREEVIQARKDGQGLTQPQYEAL